MQHLETKKVRSNIEIALDKIVERSKQISEELEGGWK
jgi:hypothetical protein